ncbi:MAG: tetratricopeptide repeat protein, partial [Dolichospermum sp.]
TAYKTEVGDQNNNDIVENQVQSQHKIIKKTENNSLAACIRATDIRGVRTLSNSPKNSPVVTLQNPKLIIVAAIATLSLIISSILLVKSTQSCPAGEKKEFGVFCVADNSKISRGERTLFHANINTSTFRDQGIQAFQKGDYEQAAKFFKKAIEANKNDPEVVIYYNSYSCTTVHLCV